MELSPSAHTDTFCRDHLPPAETWPLLEFTISDVQYPDRLNAGTALLDGTIAAHGADRPCMSSLTETWSYGRMREQANRIANVLTSELAVVPGNRVLLRGPNTPWLVACWLAVLKAGAVVVTTVPMLRAHELSTLVDLTQPAVSLCDERSLAELAAAGGPPIITYHAGDCEGPDHPAGCLNRRCVAAPAEYTDVTTAADDVALLAPTSGSTGVPKITMHFHRDILANADTFDRYVVRTQPDDLVCGTPPLAFTFGLGGLVVFPMRVGAASLLVEKAPPAELADIVAEHGVTVLYTAPTGYRAMLKAGKSPQVAGLRRAVSAGEHLPDTVWQDWYDATGLRIIDGLGSTEMLHVFISAADGDIRPGATGLAVPGYRARVVDADGNDAPDGTAGRLAVVGPTGCRYLDGDRQERYVQDGWNITGDTYVRDGDGYFWYQARSDDMIVSSGYNIGAPEVEWAVNQHPDVAESAVIGTPDPDRGMVVHAFVVLRDGVSADAAKAAEIQEFTKGLIAPYKYPRRIDFLAALPRTDTGKLQRYRLRESQVS